VCAAFDDALLLHNVLSDSPLTLGTYTLVASGGFSAGAGYRITDSKCNTVAQHSAMAASVSLTTVTSTAIGGRHYPWTLLALRCWAGNSEASRSYVRSSAIRSRRRQFS
jgi:hypothetical protein